MVLSADGDHPMTRLSDTQLVILSAAAQREDLSVLPLPDSLALKGGALNKVIGSLRIGIPLDRAQGARDLEAPADGEVDANRVEREGDTVFEATEHELWLAVHDLAKYQPLWAIELLRAIAVHYVDHSLTRPQLDRSLLAIKTARPGSTFPFGAAQLTIGKKTFGLSV